MIKFFTNRQSVFNTLLVFGFLVSIFGCGMSRTEPLIQEVVPNFPPNICRVAVLPFENNTDYQQGGNLVYRIFMTELQRSGNYNIAQEGDVRALLRQSRIGPGQKPDIEKIKILADTLKAQVIITGQLIDLDEEFQAGVLTPKLAINMQISDGPTGKMMWNTYHSRTGEDFRKVLHFGYINTVSKLAKHVSQEIITLWFQKGFPQCSEQPSS